VQSLESSLREQQARHEERARETAAERQKELDIVVEESVQAMDSLRRECDQRIAAQTVTHMQAVNEEAKRKAEEDNRRNQKERSVLMK
jgi:hypothetical protein